MAYEKTQWVNYKTKLNAKNLNKIEEGVEAASTQSQDNASKIAELEESINELEIVKSDLSAETTARKADVKEVKEDLAKAIDEINEALNSTNENIEAEKTRAENKEDELQSRLSATETQIGEWDVTKETIAGTVGAIDRQIIEINDDLNNEETGIKHRLDTHQSAISSITADGGTIDLKVNNLKEYTDGLVDGVSGDMTLIEGRVTANEAQIKLNKDTIESKVAKADVYIKDETYTKTEAESLVKQAADEITQTVSAKYETKDAASEIVQDYTSKFEQTAQDISAKVSSVQNDDTNSVGWSLKTTGFSISSNNKTVMNIGTTGNLEVTGTVHVRDGEIGGFTIGETSIYNGLESLTDNSHEGVYVGTDGIRVGTNTDHILLKSDGTAELTGGIKVALKGASAYQIAKELDPSIGTEADWIASLKGEDGQPGTAGKDGADGAAGEAGKSAYELAVEGGYEGTEEEWLASLKGERGEKGEDGKSINVKAEAGDCTAPGDGYIDDRGHLMIYSPETVGGWRDGGQIKGPQGDIGPAGPQGPAGDNGKSVFILYNDSIEKPDKPSVESMSNWHEALTEDSVWMSQKVSDSIDGEGDWSELVRIMSDRIVEIKQYYKLTTTGETPEFVEDEWSDEFVTPDENSRYAWAVIKYIYLFSEPQVGDVYLQMYLAKDGIRGAKNYMGQDTPTDASVGDIWFCTIDKAEGYKKDTWYYYNGTAWIKLQDGDILELNKKAGEFETSIDGLTSNYAKVNSSVTTLDGIVGGLSETVTEHTASINANATAIELKADSESVTELSNKLTTEYSTTEAMNVGIEIAAERIKSSAAATYESKGAAETVKTNLESQLNTKAAEINAEVNKKVSSTSENTNKTFGWSLTAEQAEFYTKANGEKTPVLTINENGATLAGKLEITGFAKAGDVNTAKQEAIDAASQDAATKADAAQNAAISEIDGRDYQTKEQVTTITEDTLKTTNIEAENLQVQAAKIKGTLTANQINTDGLKAEYIEVNDDNGDIIFKADVKNKKVLMNAANITGTLNIGRLPDTVAQKKDIPTDDKIKAVISVEGYAKSEDIPDDSDFIKAINAELDQEDGNDLKSKITTIADGVITTATLRADQIDASDLHVSAANIDGELNATQINTTGLSAEKIEVWKDEDILFKVDANNPEEIKIGGDGTYYPWSTYKFDPNVSLITEKLDFTVNFGKALPHLSTQNTIFGLYLPDKDGDIVNCLQEQETAAIKYNLQYIDTDTGVTTDNSTKVYIQALYNAKDLYNNRDTKFELWYEPLGSGEPIHEADYDLNIKKSDIIEKFINNYSIIQTGEAIEPTGFNVKSGAIYSGMTSYDDTTCDGVYLGKDGIGLGKGNFYVTNNGKMYAKNAEIEGTITATSGYIGNNLNGFCIEDTNLHNGTDSMDSTNKGIYLGTDGINLAGTFKVTNMGELTAENASISGEIKSTSGYIGGFTIGEHSISAGKDVNKLMLGNNVVTEYKATMIKYQPNDDESKSIVIKLTFNESIDSFDLYIARSSFVDTNGASPIYVSKVSSDPSMDWPTSDSHESFCGNYNPNINILDTDLQDINNYEKIQYSNITKNSFLYINMNVSYLTIPDKPSYYGGGVFAIRADQANKVDMYPVTGDIDRDDSTITKLETYNDLIKAGKNFTVDYKGNTTIKGNITAEEGKIAAFNIKDDKLTNLTGTGIGAKGVELSNNGINVGNGTKISAYGDMSINRCFNKRWAFNNNITNISIDAIFKSGDPVSLTIPRYKDMDAEIEVKHCVYIPSTNTSVFWYSDGTSGGAQPYRLTSIQANSDVSPDKNIIFGRFAVAQSAAQTGQAYVNGYSMSSTTRNAMKNFVGSSITDVKQYCAYVIELSISPADLKNICNGAKSNNILVTVYREFIGITSVNNTQAAFKTRLGAFYTSISSVANLFSIDNANADALMSTLYTAPDQTDTLVLDNGYLRNYEDTVRITASGINFLQHNAESGSTWEKLTWQKIYEKLK